MRALRAAGPVTQGQLGALLDVSPASVVQIVDHLRGARPRRPASATPTTAAPTGCTCCPAAAARGRRGARSLAAPQRRGTAARGAGTVRDLVRLLQKFLAAPVAPAEASDFARQRHTR